MAGIAFAHASEGALWELAGDCERSEAAHRAAVEILRDIPGSLLLGLALTELGDRTILCGDDIDGGIAMLDEAIELNRKTGYAFALAPALGTRAYSALRQGNREMARTLFQESMMVAREYSDDRRTFGGIVGLAAVALDEGDPRRAAQLIGVAQAALEKSPVTRLIAYPFHRDRVYEAVQAQLGTEQYQEMVDQGRTIPYDRVLTELLENIEDPHSST
jgi:tetratricopeptide (TPR) repeat protein